MANGTFYSQVNRGNRLSCDTSSSQGNRLSCAPPPPGSITGASLYQILTEEQRNKLKEYHPDYTWVATYNVSGVERALERLGVPLTDEQKQKITGGPSQKPGCSSCSSVPRAIQITSAPAYEPTPEQKAWEQFYRSQIQGIIEQKGIGLPEDAKRQMLLQQQEVVRAGEEEQLTQLRRSLEKRGLLNTPIAVAEEQRIKSQYTLAMAQAARDVELQDALMRVSSYENALGRAASFLAYLANESSKRYEPQFQTWYLQQQARLQQYQAELDAWKMGIQQQYTMQQIQAEYAAKERLLQMEMEWKEKMTKMELQYKQQAVLSSEVGKILGSLFFFALSGFNPLALAAGFFL